MALTKANFTRVKKKQQRAEVLMSRRQNWQKQIRSQMWVSTPLVIWLKSWLHYRLPHSHDSQVMASYVSWGCLMNIVHKSISCVNGSQSVLPYELQNAINNFASEFDSFWSSITLLLLLPPLLLTWKCLRLMLMIKMWGSCFDDFC